MGLFNRVRDKYKPGQRVEDTHIDYPHKSWDLRGVTVDENSCTYSPETKKQMMAQGAMFERVGFYNNIPKGFKGYTYNPDDETGEQCW